MIVHIQIKNMIFYYLLIVINDCIEFLSKHNTETIIFYFIFIIIIYYIPFVLNFIFKNSLYYYKNINKI